MDNWEDERPEGEEDEDEEGGGTWQPMGRSATIFLIDAAREMFEVPKGDEGGDAPFTIAVKALHATLMHKAVASPRDLVALVFFNTEKAKNKLDYHGVFVAQELQQPSAESVLAVEELIMMTPAEFGSKFGHMDRANIHDALRTCQSVLMDCEKRQLGRSVLLFTCRDNPHGRDEQWRRQAIAKARDFKESKVDLEVLHMGAAFDFNKFYKDLLFDDTDEDETSEQRIVADPTTRLNQLMERVTRLEQKPRPSCKTPFKLAPDVEMTVGIYTVIRGRAGPGAISQKLWRNTNQEVKSVTKHFLENTGELLVPSDFGCSMDWEGKEISFTRVETSGMANIYEPGMALLGFKPMSFLESTFHVDHCSFVYPMEQETKGGTKLFSALLHHCLAKQLVVLIRSVPRMNSAVTFAALVPQKEELDDGNAQITPPGFWLHPLPYADDIGTLDDVEGEKEEEPSEKAVKAFETVLEKMQIDYRPHDFDDPSVETHRENIKALALNRQHVEEVPDYTAPDLKMIQKLYGRDLDELERVIFPPGYDPMAKIPSSQPSRSAPKKEKVDPSSVDVAAMLKAGKGNSLTVAVLKAWLTERCVSVTAKKKAELVQDALDLLN